MNIGIIGHGFVGSAVAAAHKHDQLTIVDPKLSNSATFEDLDQCDAIYICVPSPLGEDRSCNTAILENVLHELKKSPHFFLKVIISKVTAPPSAYLKLQEKYPNLVHSPEFLTAKNAINDYANSKLTVIGGYDIWATTALSVIKQGKSADAEIITDIVTAALYKYLANSFLATKVTFMNEFYELARAYGVEWESLSTIASFDDRLGKGHLSVPGPDGKYGWGGMCFPKDIAAICTDASIKNVQFDLIRQVEKLNQRHRRKQ